jgi:hypothetical protein
MEKELKRLKQSDVIKKDLKMVNLQDENMAQRIIHLARNVLGVEPCVGMRENTFEIRSGQKQVILFFRKHGFFQGRKLT